jgi:hypothetical protein
MYFIFNYLKYFNYYSIFKILNILVRKIIILRIPFNNIMIYHYTIIFMMELI